MKNNIVEKIEKFHKWILFGLVVFAALLRFINIGTNPPSLTWDEVAWGYNAYSLGIDGKDEYGNFLPITFLESFGDYKPPVYAYVSIIPVKIFGLNEFSTRFASAFFGVLTVLLTYFLTKEIFFAKSPNEKEKQRITFISLMATFLLSISPWHTLLSRAAFEANVATFFIVGGVLCFLLSLRKYPYLIVISLLLFVISMYTFNTARIVAPLLVLGFFIIKRKTLWNMKKQVVIGCVVAAIIFLPLLLFLRTPQAQLRFKEVNIFTDASVVERANKEMENDKGAWWSKIIHNRRLGYSVEYLRHYFHHFEPTFLFIKGDENPKFSTQDVGEMFLWEMPFFVLGILVLLKKREGNWWVIPLWVIIGIIPAATARETPHALRIEAIVPTFQILTALGFVSFFIWLFTTNTSLLVKKIITVGMITIIIGSLVYYLHGYYNYYQKEFSHSWQYGYKDAITYATSQEDKFDQIFLTDVLGRPYAYTLFYTRYNPKQFRKNAIIKRDVFGFVHVKSFDKYIFDKQMVNGRNGEKILYIDHINQVPSGGKIQKVFKLVNGEIVLVAYTN